MAVTLRLAIALPLPSCVVCSAVHHPQPSLALLCAARSTSNTHKLTAGLSFGGTVKWGFLGNYGGLAWEVGCSSRLRRPPTLFPASHPPLLPLILHGCWPAGRRRRGLMLRMLSRGTWGLRATH